MKVARKIRKLGWQVLRIWEHEIRNSPFRAVARLKSAILKRCGNTELPQPFAEKNVGQGLQSISPGT